MELSIYFLIQKAHRSIVTGGNDGVIYFWDPFVTERPAAILRGHNSSITHLVIDNREDHVISIDKGKSTSFIRFIKSQFNITSFRYHHLGYSNLKNHSTYISYNSRSLRSRFNHMLFKSNPTTFNNWS